MVSAQSLIAPDGTKAGELIPGVKGGYCWQQFCCECKSPIRVRKSEANNRLGCCKYCRVSRKHDTPILHGLVPWQRHGKQHTDS